MDTEQTTIDQLEDTYKKKLSQLRPLQRRFVEEYLIDLNTVQAAIRAGYSKSSAQKQCGRLSGNSLVSACISLAQEIRSRRTQISQEWVLINLKEQYEQANDEKNRSACNRSLELIGQHLGMFGKKDDSGKHLHLHQDKYVNFPPVPETIKEWVEQMKEVGYDASIEGEANEKIEENTSIGE